MGHAVHHLAADGTSRFELVPTLEAALELVERLRNEDEVSDVRVFREVPIEVRTYYKVVVADEDVAAAPAAPVEEPVAATAPVEDAVVPAPEAVVEEGHDEPAEEQPVPALSAVPSVPSEPPSGAMVITPPPVTVHPEVDVEPTSEHRRPLFSRG